MSIPEIQINNLTTRKFPVKTPVNNTIYMCEITNRVSYHLRTFNNKRYLGIRCTGVIRYAGKLSPGTTRELEKQFYNLMTEKNHSWPSKTCLVCIPPELAQNLSFFLIVQRNFLQSHSCYSIWHTYSCELG